MTDIVEIGGTNWSHQITKHQAEKLDELAVRIANFATGAIMHEIEAGKALLEARAMFPADQEFGQWRGETLPDMDRKYALRLMQVAQEFGDKPLVLQSVSFSVARRLAAPSTPQAVRDAVERGVETGETFTEAKVQTMIAEERRKAAEAAKRAEDAEAKAADAEARADSLLDGQQALVARAKADAEAKAKADLEAAKAEAADAQRTLEAERRKLTEAAAKAEQAALDRAKAEAADLAKAALAEVEADVRKAKQAEAEARQRVEKLTANADRLAARVKEHDDALRKMKGADIEAGALRERMTEVIRVVTMAMGDIHDIEHEHGPEVQQSMARAASVCRQFAEALDHFAGPRLVYDREGAQA